MGPPTRHLYTCTCSALPKSPNQPKSQPQTQPQHTKTNPKQVLVGCESGVALYDALTHALSKALNLSVSSSSLSSPSPAGDTTPTTTTTTPASFPHLQQPALLNAPELSAARRDKFEMTECVRRAGLRAARQLRTARYGLGGRFGFWGVMDGQLCVSIVGLMGGAAMLTHTRAISKQTESPLCCMFLT